MTADDAEMPPPSLSELATFVAQLRGGQICLLLLGTRDGDGWHFDSARAYDPSLQRSRAELDSIVASVAEVAARDIRAGETSGVSVITHVRGRTT